MLRISRISFASAIALSLLLPARAEEPPAMATVMARGVEWLTQVTPASPPPLSQIATAQPLHKGKRTDATELAAKFVGAQLLAVAAYDKKPTTLASDLSQQLANAENVPAGALAPLLVDAEKKARANEVAANWAAELLEAADNDAIGACVFWIGDGESKSLLSENPPEARLILCIFRAQRFPGSAELVITRIAWGNPTDLMK